MKLYTLRGGRSLYLKTWHFREKTSDRISSFKQTIRKGKREQIREIDALLYLLIDTIAAMVANNSIAAIEDKTSNEPVKRILENK